MRVNCPRIKITLYLDEHGGVEVMEKNVYYPFWAWPLGGEPARDNDSRRTPIGTLKSRLSDSCLNHSQGEHK